MEKSISHTYHIGGMSCGGCVSTVKQKFGDVTSPVAGMANMSSNIAQADHAKY